MDKQTIDILQAGLAQADSPADIATLINALAQGDEGQRGQCRTSFLN